MAANIYEKAIGFSIAQHRIGVTRKIDSRRVSIDNGSGEQPESNSIGVNKKILDCPELKEIQRTDADLLGRMRAIAVCAPLKAGTYLIPIPLIDRIDGMVSEYLEARKERVNAFLSVYGEAVEEARKRLGAVFNPADYPPLESVRASFFVETAYIDFGVPGRLKEIRPKLFARERAAFKEKLENAAEEIRLGMRAVFQDLVNHMIQRLAPATDGKKKVFKRNLIENLAEFMDSFADRNIADDEELKKIIGVARECLKGKTPEMIREDKDIAEGVRKGMEVIKEKLDGMISTAASRKFNLDE